MAGQRKCKAVARRPLTLTGDIERGRGSFDQFSAVVFRHPTEALSPQFSGSVRVGVDFVTRHAARPRLAF
jgi:hypothetical protein